MKAAIIKDFLTCKTYLKTYLMFSLLFIVVSIVTSNSSYIMGILMIIPVMSLVTTFSYDEYSNWERLALCSTLSRKDIVNAKYVMATLLTGIGFAISFIVYLSLKRIL